MPPEITYDWVKKDSIDRAPIWCSVDEDIIKASIAALVSAVNKLATEQHITEAREDQTVEAIAVESGYENVEHFNRLFKKSYGVTPVQYRRQG